ncbi:HutD family protein [Brevibacterium spongiae]|uniref:HutD family protein n=1 Tax=Brevibacterium spongiae TaxID=2909672 RepID=A0ABY5SUU5_9MICO|nr:HutD family protein [Brevibacterium spongiae]UVI36816.1 HutD family protein [Brevibacterium spongiae]
MRALASFADRPAVAWANGAGETTELVSLAGSATLTPGLRPWRLSIARLDRPSPFSPLPTLARTFLPTSEVVLEIDGQERRVGPAEPARFHGSQEVNLVGLAESCFAINLMVDETESGVGDLGDGGGDDVLSMSVGVPIPTHEFRFVLTLHPTPDHPRFCLLALEPDDVLADERSVVGLSGPQSGQ